MPKTDIDYSNTIIYKITCKDSNVTDVYVGHTTNFVQRKHAHKQNCVNEKATNYKCKLYEVIRNNGGWQNWNMEIINFFKCHDHYEARQKEQEYFISLNATLNSIEPMPKPKPKPNPKVIFIKNKIMQESIYCDKCKINCNTLKTFEKHCKTTSHSKVAKMEMDFAPKVAKKFNCNLCDYLCDRKNDYSKHLLTDKHVNKVKGTKMELNVQNKNISSNLFNCNKCNKIYNTSSGLWKHSKKCIKKHEETATAITSMTAPSTTDEIKSITLMVVELMKSNQDLQKQMLEVCKNSNNNSHNNNNNHSHNKTFNMQFFLNEQCKDAMNIMEFVDTFKLDFSDLERVGEIGYVECMSNIIIQKLNEMDIYKRPIHCSDAKRETMFVKDKDVWEKDDETHARLRLAIRYIAKKNSDMLNRWCDAHPGSCDSDNYLNDLYLEMVMQAMGGRGNREENENKIMRKIARTCLIDKNM